MRSRIAVLDAAAIAKVLSRRRTPGLGASLRGVSGAGGAFVPPPGENPAYEARRRSWEVGIVRKGFSYRRAEGAARVRGPFTEHRTGNRPKG